MYQKNDVYDGGTDLEREQMQKLDKLRKLIQSILQAHIVLLSIVFVLILGALLAFVGLRTTHSSGRYLARLTLCYHPKHKGKIGQYDDKYVLTILNRHATRQAFFDRGEARDADRQWVSNNIVIEMDRKQPHSFSIGLYAKSEEAAVTLINEFASVCIQEYSAERTRDLEQWRSVLEAEKKGLYAKVQEVNAEFSALTLKLQMISPEKDYEQLRMHISELQNARSRLALAVQSQVKRRDQLSAELSEVNPLLLVHQNEIKEFFKDLETLDREIAKEGELYTDENPKMIALHSRRNSIQNRLDEFLKGKKIRSVDEQTIRRAETLSAELRTVQSELDVKENEKNALDNEIDDCKKRIALFNENQPKLQKISQQRHTLQESMQRLDESISEINYTLLMVKEDLFVNEIAKSAVGNQPFSRKNLIICLFAAFAATSFLAVLTILMEFFFGRVADAKEMHLYEELHYLGALPTSEKLFHSQEREKIAFNALFHHFQTMNPHVVFTSALPGAKVLPKFFDFMEWNYAMAGKRSLIMNLVLAEMQEPMGEPDKDQPNTILVAFSGGKCFLPVANRKFLDPSEFELLKNDFKVLRERYDCIFLRYSFQLRRSKIFMEQIASLCDAALFAVGAGKTPRKNLRFLLTLQAAIKIPVMTILTESETKNLNKDLNLEVES